MHYAKPFPANIANHVVPPSRVQNEIMSTPADDNVGALPPAHLVPLGHVTVRNPMFVRCRINACDTPLAGGLLTVTVNAPLPVAVVLNDPAVAKLKASGLANVTALCISLNEMPWLIVQSA